MKSFSKLYLSHPGRLSSLTALVGSLSISPFAASAQVIDMNNSGVQKGIMEAVSKALQSKFDAMMSRTVKITPEISELKPGARTVAIEIENPTDDTLTINLVNSRTVPKMYRFISKASAAGDDSVKGKSSTKTTSILADDEAGETTGEDDGTHTPMGPWLGGLPKKYVIAPKAKIKVVIDVAIPVDVAAGQYVTWISAEVEPKKESSKPKDEKNQLEATLPGGAPLKINVASGGANGEFIVVSSAKIVYKHTSVK